MLHFLIEFYSFSSYHSQLSGWVIPAIIGVASIVANAIGQRRAEKRYDKKQMELAKFQADTQEAYLDKQLDYNSPESQMKRFSDAGLNPHLVYGQGNPGNQSEPLKAPPVSHANYQNVLGGIAQTLNQTSLTASQVAATDAKTRQTTVLTELNQLQAEVIKKNPLLDESGFKAIIDSLVSTAEIKASESGIRKSQMFVQQASAGHQVSKIFQELQVLEQRFKLGQADEKIKAEVLQSKEFQNAILEIQKKWMTEADITPQHIYQFIQMFLLKLL